MVDWEQARLIYPGQWLVVESQESHIVKDKRVIGKVSGIEPFGNDFIGALHRCMKLHKSYPKKEFYFAHTSQAVFDIYENAWNEFMCAPKGISFVLNSTAITLK